MYGKPVVSLLLEQFSYRVLDWKQFRVRMWVLLFGRRAVSAAQWLQKGDVVIVTGELYGLGNQRHEDDNRGYMPKKIPQGVGHTVTFVHSRKAQAQRDLEYLQRVEDGRTEVREHLGITLPEDTEVYDLDPEVVRRLLGQRGDKAP